MKTNKETYYIIDFDSTFTQVEALDILGEIALHDAEDKQDRLQQIKDITDRGMDGSQTLRESLEQRLALLNAHKNHLPKLIEELKKHVSTSFKRNTDFFNRHREQIYILSNGFKDFIVPIVTDYNIKAEHVFANTFEFDENDNIVGYDKDNVLSSNQGKVEQLKKLDLQGDVFVIGDGYTDYEIKAAGLADKFYVFTENISRKNILEKADHITPSLDEFLYLNNMNTALSYPKNRINVLLLEGVHPKAIELMKSEGYNVSVHPSGMDEDELCEKIKNVSILGIRSKTQVTQKVLDHANRLIAIGAFCIGTNQIDLEACLHKGVAVFNAPFSNTRSVVELAIANIIMLMRQIFDRSVSMHKGHWDKSAQGSFEIRGKTLGIVGYGNIGSQLSVLGESLGLKILYYDVEEKLALGNATKCATLKDLLNQADIVTMHVDGRTENRNLIGEQEFGWMKNGVIFINLSRGHIVDIEALKNSVQNGKVAGVAVDVFPDEPKNNDEEFVSALRGLPNTILSPHIGGSTIEAQENIADFVPNKIMDYINTGSTSISANFPNLQLPKLENAHRLIHIHENTPGILARINQLLADHNINIVGQYLKTNETIGYVITDIDKAHDSDIIKALRGIDHTIKSRVLY
ncbi:MAG: D-3-phosphoglycerate dehydrogenase [Candidatus Latescibacterota bacterium]|jgi:D-3-phosphoglycerate dehydrogenase